MTKRNFEALRYAAQAVIDEAGEGWFGEDHPLQETDSFDELAPVPMVDMRHIALTSPETILAMLARITELEEQMAAVGAGGVEPLRKADARREQQAVNDALRRAAHCCYLLDNSDNSPSYRAAATWCAERILALCTPQEKTP